MNRPLFFSSPLSPPDCIQRLQKLVERRDFYFAAGLFGTVHVILDSIESESNSFRLLLRCSTRGNGFLPLIYLKLNGKMHSSKDETTMQLWLESDNPRSIFDWAFLAFRLFLAALTLLGAIIGIMTSSLFEGVFIGLVCILAVSGGFWVYRQTYRISVKHLLNLIYHTLQHDNSETQSQNSNEVEWLSSLSKSQ